MNEMWASEVERRLRLISDRLGSLSQASLRLEGAANFGFPTTQPPTETDTGEEIIWIRLTDKMVIGGVNTYAWRRQIYVMSGGGMAWVDTGESGTLAENPAIGLNNEDRLTTDGKRYPAKYNPDTAQLIFFLRLEEESASPWISTCKIRLHTFNEWIDDPFPASGHVVPHVYPTWPTDFGFVRAASPSVAQLFPASDYEEYASSWHECTLGAETLTNAEWTRLDISGTLQSTYTVRATATQITAFIEFKIIDESVIEEFHVLTNIKTGLTNPLTTGTSGLVLANGFTGINTTQLRYSLAPIGNYFATGYPFLEVCWGGSCP